MDLDESVSLIIEAIKTRKCLPFLGAGASCGYSNSGVEEPGIPLGGQLAQIIAQQCSYVNGASYDLAKVAEYFIYKKNGHRNLLEEVIEKEINRITLARPIHTVLAQLQEIQFLMTSNYDELFEGALKQYQRKPKIHYHDPTNPKTGHFRHAVRLDPHEIVVHKMHGTVANPRSMIITRSDYIRYLANVNSQDRGMPEYFRKYVIPDHTLLFLGYSLEDWNFQVIWEGVLADRDDVGAEIQSYALVKSASPFQKAYWARRNISLIECDLTDFATHLAHLFNLEIPQLGITKGGPKP